ncbi:orphan sodium- and chloride-dependent neurotransmitter transporter NTT5 isoform X1 [Ornithorhynchus anatinus]|uniref:Transporter n=2 Tax=Ornithorhynchus anatinus TaxID=9258 RepID=F7BHH8_ORNAN|nr:orphan sodium- and chloride-dependent neurotransmitter transporter NTT5 isoform X1 [Ornithorhynchus anatinus]XP_028929258.1 orphan sodium- and chloride-dependent neurotransmitter transporter NTT5 isoform X1 [Ornithorhynchus anatinus]
MEMEERSAAANQEAGEEEEGKAPVSRQAWANKTEYILAQVGFSVGLGNVWRFPYLCHQNGGGTFLLLYVLLLTFIGIPLLFMEMAAGQDLRQGSIGVWKRISPRLGGVGYASCVVCAFVGLYYNVILAWSLFYLSHSFQAPLPWQSCPLLPNSTDPVPECDHSSPTTYFWYRKTLEATGSIGESGGLVLALSLALLAAWFLICGAMIRGIKSSGKVLYFSTLFPYLVLLCLLIRGLLLDGANAGLKHMLQTQPSALLSIPVWRRAGTQVFFALGLGFGSVVAFASYTPRENNCARDAWVVAYINLATSLLATLVVYTVLGFRATTLTRRCAIQNAKALVQLTAGNLLPSEALPLTNLSDMPATTFNDWFRALRPDLAAQVRQFNVSSCSLEEELNKGVEGPGLAFVVFTEALTLFPGAPFWAVLFFLMLLNLGLSTMLGTLQGILTPLQDAFHLLRRHRTLLTIGSCLLGFLGGLLFTQGSGSYFLAMFDDYSATLPLIAVVVCENMAVAWVYGADRFLEDVEVMLGHRPWPGYRFLWRYVTLVGMVGLLVASTVQICLQVPTYRAWDAQKAQEVDLPYPPWALAMLIILIVLAIMPIPFTLLYRLYREYQAQKGISPRELIPAPADGVPANGYVPVRTE